MKRNMSLVRSILLWAIDHPHGYLPGNPELEGYTEEQISYHVYLMHQAGLVRAAVRDVLGSRSPEALLLEVTWAGHEFASAAQDEALWRRAGATVLREGASFSFDLLKAWLDAQAKAVLGMP